MAVLAIVQHCTLKLCFFIQNISSGLFLSQLKDEAVALVDALAPPDFILNSPIGHSSGKVREFDNFIV